MGIKRTDFGVLETGDIVSLYALECGPLRATVTDYGATLVSLLLPPHEAGGEDICLGFSTLAGYTSKHPHFGATVGRVAGRIGGASFKLGGREYPLDANDGRASLHGGHRGFDRHLWKGDAYEEGGEPRLRLSRRSPAGEEGYPANLDVVLTFGLSRSQELILGFEAKSDGRTVVNLTNHAYFNLRGEGRGDIASHEIEIRASRYVETGEGLVPTGRILPVEGSPYDLRKPRPLAEGIASLGGFDTCFVIDRDDSFLSDFGTVTEPGTGRRMVLRSSFPGLQFYTGNFLSGEIGKHGARYQRHAGFCLEAQYFPDAPNHPEFPSIELPPGVVWRHETRFGFEF
jgi:aldose 1-epimerase